MKNTFGKTLAAHKLEVLLEKQPYLRRKVSSILSEYTNSMLKIVACKDPTTITLCWSLLREYTFKRIDNIVGLPEEVKSYTKNIIVARYRTYYHGFDSVMKLIRYANTRKVE